MIDNASEDGTPEMVRGEFRHVMLLTLDRNSGGAGGFRQGMAWAHERGFGWLVRSVYMDYKRPLKMSDYFIVKTTIDSIEEKKCRINFEILNKATNKTCCDGWFEFVMIDLKSGKGVLIPADIIEHYAK